MPGIDQAILGIAKVAELLKLVEGPNGELDERCVLTEMLSWIQGPRQPCQQANLGDLDDRCECTSSGVEQRRDRLAACAVSAVKPGDTVSISDFQIVNGCQTSHCLHHAKGEMKADGVPVYVPIRLVVTEDDDVATRIIRATNSQTAVQENELIACTKFQKQLEDF